MDEIKSKVIKFVKKQEQNKDEEGEDSNSIRHSAIQRPKPAEPTIDEIEDDVVLSELPNFYYNNSQDFDVQYYILKGLPPDIKCQDIKLQLRTLYRQHGVVSKKTLRQILEKESSYKLELERVGQVQNELAVALSTIRDGRAQVHSIKEKFTWKGLGLLRNVKRKKTFQQLLFNLKTIRTLQKSEEKVLALLTSGDFPCAIRLLVESQGVAASLKRFKCVAQLSWKLQDNLDNTENHLDAALSLMCKNFNSVTYTKLQEAYTLLDKTQTLMDQLLMHFTSELHSSMFKVVHSHVPNAQAKQFQHLCKLVPSKSYVTCLQTLCQEIWFILNSYYKVIQWHKRKDAEISNKSEVPGRDIERSLNKQYVKQKLENGQTRLWNDVQAKISIFILGHDFSDCKFEDLLQILGLLHRLTEIGTELCESKSEDIFKCIRQQTVSYFQSYHSAKLEELRIFLENEIWAPCPVRHSFTLTHLQEFKTLRHAIESHRKPKRDAEGSGSTKDSDTRASNSNLSTDGSSVNHNNLFARFADAEGATPFDGPMDDTISEDFLDLREDLSGYYSDSSDDTDTDELKKAFVDDLPQPEPSHTKKKKDKSETKKKPCGPLLVNTTLTVLRQCGSYLQMCRLLKPIALDVVVCMCQLFDYYLYNVFHFFTADLPLQSSAMVSFKLQASLKRIDDNLILKCVPEETPNDNRRRIVASHLSEMVHLDTKESLYGLAERVTGVESLVFLGKQFEYIQPYVLHLVPDDKRHFIDQFYSQTVACVGDLRRAAYMCVSAHVVDLRQTVKEMTGVNFDVKEITSQHSPYVDKIVREMQIFSMKLEECEVEIPADAELVIWENIIHVVNNILVEGFSCARKCSNSGRALMLLDYTQLVTKVQKMTPLQRMPNKQYVEDYVKAFYLQENNLDDWILQHREYSSKQLEGLVYCVCQNSNKKTRQRLLQLLENR